MFKKFLNKGREFYLKIFKISYDYPSHTILHLLFIYLFVFLHRNYESIAKIHILFYLLCSFPAW